MKKEYSYIIGLMVLLHIILFMWKTLTQHAFGLSQAFEMKMATMTGMVILTVIIVIISHYKKTNLSVLPVKYNAATNIILVISVLMIASTAVLFTKSDYGIWLMIYGSLITPLFEELLFRGHIYAIQQKRHIQSYQVIVLNALLFSIWHLGYIINPLISGEWMALSKMLVGFLYGMILAYIRHKTGSTLCSILAHGALNSIAG